MRTYNPQLEKTLEQWGVMALPKQYERERRFVNLYRQHDYLRSLSDDAIALMQTMVWPGNVRQLKNLVERVLILGGGTGPREARELPGVEDQGAYDGRSSTSGAQDKSPCALALARASVLRPTPSFP